MSELSSQHHSFDMLPAKKYGVEEAILIHHFLHWIRINRAAGRNVRDGRCWTYQTRKDIQIQFPYWNVDRVKYLCEKLVKLGVMVSTGKYNKSPIDKTLWYAFVDEKAFGVDEESSNNLYERQKCPSKGKSASSKGKSASPIPDTKPDTETKDKKEETPIVPKRDLPSSSKSRKRIAEEKKERSSRVLISDTQHEDLLAKANRDEALLKSWYDKLSTWKIGKGVFGGANDYQSITNWVIQAVKDAPKSETERKEELTGKNRDLAQKIKKAYPQSKDILVGESYIEFDRGAMLRPHIKFSDNGFEEQVFKNLKDMNLWKEELCLN